MKHPEKKQNGFTLIELAVVIMVIGLLVGGSITALTRYVGQARIKQAEADLDVIREALIGYVIINNRFPCPDTDGFPPSVGVAPPSTGSENFVMAAGCTSAPNTIGYLPAADLGVQALDPWGMRYFYRVNWKFADATPAGAMSFTLNEVGDKDDLDNINVYSASGGAAVVANMIPALVFSTGPNKAITLALASNDEDENINRDVNFVSKPFVPEDSSQESFDDIVKWIPGPVLIYRLVQAGKLP